MFLVAKNWSHLHGDVFNLLFLHRLKINVGGTLLYRL